MFNYDWKFNEKINQEINQLYTKNYLKYNSKIKNITFIVEKIEVFKISYITLYKNILKLLKSKNINLSEYNDKLLIKKLRNYMLNDFKLVNLNHQIF